MLDSLAPETWLRVKTRYTRSERQHKEQISQAYKPPKSKKKAVCQSVKHDDCVQESGVMVVSV